MKSIFTILFFVFISEITQAQIVDIPDPNFKARLLEASPALNIAFNSQGNPVTVDINNNGEIEISEALNIFRLEFFYDDISDLTGIQAFTNLNYLDCSGNFLSDLDISVNNNLEYLVVANNQLTNIDISQNHNLIRLDVSFNQLSHLNISLNPVIEILRCQGNILTELDVSQQPNLLRLDCSNNNLTALDITQNPNLVRFEAYANNLTTLDLTQNVNLERLEVGSNNLSDLDLSQNLNLKYFNCYNNQITYLDLSNNDELEYWSCLNNQITNINIKNGGYSWNIDLWDAFVSIGNNPIEYICADEQEILAFQELTNYQGPISSYCSFTPGGEYNTITGNSIFDADNDGCDDSDYELSNIRISIDDGTTSGSMFSNQSSAYTFYTEIGNYQLIPQLENPSIFNVTPLNVDIDFTDLNNTVNQNFCITANGIHNDLEIVIVPTVPAQPGFDASYQLVYKNKGNQVLSGSVEFDYDETVLDFLSTSVTPTSQNMGSLSWDYADLYPFESRVVDVVFNVNSPMETPAVNIDDILDFTASINPIADDYTPVDNAFTLDQIVVGSYDPNDITCLEGDIVSPDKIGEYLHYNIRFENTGTAPATFVVVRDDINEAQYDLGSLQILNSSHDMYTRINGNRVEFIFDNINLAPEEIGNVLFKIKSLETLNTGDDVAQQAEIYFDYNFPIITNIAQTSYQALSINEFDLNDSVEIFPNPTTDFFRIRSENLIQSLKVYDVHGRLVLQESLSNKETSVSFSSFKSGVYFIEVHSNSGIVIKRLIKN